ncbi:hypothetical protein G9A89_011764 [Geosiphon pyriformis]|nr:hypothetical protein G9A89_011764 [Geosiphon pyriformis]
MILLLLSIILCTDRESVAVENSSAYFPYITELATRGLNSDSSPKELYDTALQILNETNLISLPTTFSFLEFALSLHSAAPTIQAYYQYYDDSVFPSKFRNLTHDDPHSKISFNIDCEVWVDWYGIQACNIDQLKKIARITQEDSKYRLIFDSSNQPPKLLSFDHILQKSYKSESFKESPTLILYVTDILLPEFLVFHSFLLELVEQTGVGYILRYKPPKRGGQILYLSGYGVELALKKTDYIVIDDRKMEIEYQSEGGETNQNRQSKDDLISENLFQEEISEIKPLKVTEIKDLGLKAAQFILQSQNSLATLVYLSQDFPKYSHVISQLTLNESLRHEIRLNQEIYIPPATNSFWLNGMAVAIASVDPFSLLRMLRRERQTVLSLKSLGMNSRQAIDLITCPILLTAKSSESFTKGMFDVREKTGNIGAILWWNNLEKDLRYADWPYRVREILRPVFPGQMRYLRKNLFSVLYIVDLSTIEGLRMVEESDMFITKELPIRFGLVPLFREKQDDSVMMAKLLYYLTTKYEPSLALQFLSKVLKELLDSTSEISEVAREQFEAITKGQKPNDDEIRISFQEIIDVNSPINDKIGAAANFIKRFNILPDSNGAMFVNGKYFDIDELYQRNMLVTINEQTQFLQQKVYLGQIKDDTDIYQYIMSLPYLPSRRNPYVFLSEAKPLKMLNLVGDIDGNIKIDLLGYLTSEKQGENGAPVTIWVIADFDDDTGIQQGLEALKYLEKSNNSRLALIHNSSPSNVQTKPSLSFHIYRFIYENDTPSSSLTAASLKERFQTTLESRPGKNISNDSDVDPLELLGFEAIDKQKADNFWRSLKPLIKNSLQLQDGATAILVNGRIVGPFSRGEFFTYEDLMLLVDVEFSERINPFLEAVHALNITDGQKGTKYSDFVAKASSIISASTVSDSPPGLMDTEEVKRDRPYLEMQGEYSRIEIGDIDSALYQIGAIIDPVSEVAQKWSTILQTLSKIEGVHIYVSMNPPSSLSELPLTRFYRYVLDTKLNFDLNTGLQVPPSASFAGLPEEPLFTLSMDTIQVWLVTPTSSIHDLDNIKLANLDSNYRRKGVEAVFELRHLLIEGHVRDMTLNKPPGGLQLVLGTESHPTLVDTIVMANLGYFQLKANPGYWNLGLREGRSTEIFSIESVGSEGWYSRSVEEIGTGIIVNSFEGVLIFPRMKRNPGKEKQEILASDSDRTQEGIWGYFKSKFSHPKEPKKTGKAEINIFSVASGHLYERFLSIMIVSVLRHTKSLVKFWFIENFLSPSFKDFIPHMARKYNFQYELVTYKWPHWLRAQKEKQRIIWGYKILFLDVLFPLDLDKVIFVDADQIVRADLKELIDIDLKGAPYGYTPFCDNRPEIDGFRFWKEGYWKEHLQGKPYHISALYVIDLQRFRHLAAGDRLRGQYQSLSADPNSLSNLDQDLPNNMQHVVPIHSLPEEWLWCETWCSDESLARAKTIDLCNNPMTKEPKLDRARRQVPEWESYDNEVADFAASIATKLKDPVSFEEIKYEETSIMEETKASLKSITKPSGPEIQSSEIKRKIVSIETSDTTDTAKDAISEIPSYIVDNILKGKKEISSQSSTILEFSKTSSTFKTKISSPTSQESHLTKDEL